MPAFLRSFDPRDSLAAAIGWVITGIVVILAFIASVWAGAIARDNLEDIARARLQHRALRYYHEIEVEFQAHLQELQAAAYVLAKDDDNSNIRNILEGLQHLLPHLEWIGYLDTNGHTVVSTDTGQAAHDTAQSAQNMDDLHTTQISVHYPEYIEIKLPILNRDNHLKGLLVNNLRWTWVDELVKRLTHEPTSRHLIDLLIVDHDGKVLAGPAFWLGNTADHIRLPSLMDNNDESLTMRSHAASEYLDTARWPDGITYIMHCHVEPESTAPGLRWTVCAYESATDAFARAHFVQQNIFVIILGLGFIAVIIGVTLTQSIMQGLIDIAQSADELRLGVSADLHIPTRKNEIGRIGQALSLLVKALQAEQHSLQRLNSELDERVKIRTQEVERLAEENKYGAIVRERLRMARELHDTLAHSMAALLMEIRLLRRLAKSKPEQLEDELLRAEDAAQQGLREARAAIAQIRYNSARDNGLGPALGSLLKRFNEKTGIPVAYNAEAEAAELADSRAETLFRIAEEILRNIERHADAKNVRASLIIIPANTSQPANILQMTISDDGIGFNPNVLQNGHYGLLGMREQANLIRASLHIQSAPSAGTRIIVDMPIIHTIATTH